MTTLTIRVSSQNPAESTSAAQEIEVTHLLAREVSVTELMTQQVATPGVLVLLSLSENYTLAIDSKTTLLTTGLAHMLRGNAEWRIARSTLRETGASTKASVLMIQVSALINKSLSLQDLLTQTTQLDPATSKEIEQLYNDLSHTRTALVLPAGSADVMRNVVAARLVPLLLGAISSSRPQENEGPLDPRLVTLKRFMREHLAASPSIEEMARHMGMSRSMLYRWAKPQLGASPTHYLRILRLEKAQELLGNTGLSIDESKQRELAQIWCHHVSDLLNRRLSSPLPHYLSVRKEFFPNDLRCMLLTCEVLSGLGREHLIPELCPSLRQFGLFALRHAGLYRRAIAEYGGDWDARHTQQTLLIAGQYKEALDAGHRHPRLTRTGGCDAF